MNHKNFTLRVPGLLAFLGVAIWSIAAVAPLAAQQVVKVEKEWNGGSPFKKDNDLWKEAPKSGVIADAKAWAKLWKAWHGDVEVPKVDFKKEIILVAAGPGPNIIKIDELRLELRKRDLVLKFTWGITERGGDGFVFTILKVERSGYNFVNDTQLAAGQRIELEK